MALGAWSEFRVSLPRHTKVPALKAGIFFGFVPSMPFLSQIFGK